MTSEQIEEYLEAIFNLTEEGTSAKTTDISNYLKLKPASVTEMLQKLAEKGYVKYKPYRGAKLTKKGAKIAKKMVRKHRLLERFLTDVLGIKNTKVHEEACKMEHGLSDDAEEALCKLLKHPERCPDDEKLIPICDKPVDNCVECFEEDKQAGKRSKVRNKNLVALTSLKEDQKGIISFIRGGKNAVQRLCDMGLTPGAEVKIIKSAPFKGPFEILIRGSKLAIGRGIAMKIFVEAS